MENREFVVAQVQSNASDDEMALSTQVSDIEFRAESIVIQNDADYASAGEFGVMLKKKAAEVTAFFKPMKDSAHQAHKAICDREKAMLAPLKNAEAAIKRSMSTYHQEQERRRKELEEAARREADAERERLLALAQKHEENGEAEEAERALSEACFADNAKFVYVAGAPKANGVSTRKDWEIDIYDYDAVPIYVRGMEIRPVDRGALLKIVRAAKGNIKIPGVEIKEVSQMMFRR